jgi:hypothetical protein
MNNDCTYRNPALEDFVHSSGILNNYKTQRFGNWMCPFSGEEREAHTLLDSLERATLNHCTYCITHLLIQLSDLFELNVSA